MGEHREQLSQEVRETLGYLDLGSPTLGRQGAEGQGVQAPTLLRDLSHECSPKESCRLAPSRARGGQERLEPPASRLRSGARPGRGSPVSTQACHGSPWGRGVSGQCTQWPPDATHGDVA